MGYQKDYDFVNGVVPLVDTLYVYILYYLLLLIHPICIFCVEEVLYLIFFWASLEEVVPLVDICGPIVVSLLRLPPRHHFYCH